MHVSHTHNVFGGGTWGAVFPSLLPAYGHNRRLCPFVARLLHPSIHILSIHMPRQSYREHRAARNRALSAYGWVPSPCTACTRAHTNADVVVRVCRSEAGDLESVASYSTLASITTMGSVAASSYPVSAAGGSGFRSHAGSGGGGGSISSLRGLGVPVRDGTPASNAPDGGLAPPWVPRPRTGSTPASAVSGNHYYLHNAASGRSSSVGVGSSPRQRRDSSSLSAATGRSATPSAPLSPRMSSSPRLSASRDAPHTLPPSPNHVQSSLPRPGGHARRDSGSPVSSLRARPGLPHVHSTQSEPPRETKESSSSDARRRKRAKNEERWRRVRAREAAHDAPLRRAAKVSQSKWGSKGAYGAVLAAALLGRLVLTALALCESSFVFGRCRVIEAPAHDIVVDVVRDPARCVVRSLGLGYHLRRA